MTKSAESHISYSCWNKALWYERMFILLERDAAAPAAIRAWVDRRLELGLNGPGDVQIKDALFCAAMMDKDREEIRRQIEEVKNANLAKELGH